MAKTMLPQSFLLIAMVGFLVVAVYGYYGKLALPWASAFGLVFLLMIIASFMSMAPEAPKKK
jgi:hypothetical protein